ncbi:uncharacterized protein [Nicotiana tomentosiformis]|uniref:uncharacterized protein n=1 Tax=Nicotiana tomentosiformis TaxID=4098 RepID=UPI00051AEF4D
MVKSGSILERSYKFSFYNYEDGFPFLRVQDYYNCQPRGSAKLLQRTVRGSVSAACVANQRAQAADVGDQSAQSTDTLIAKSNISLRSDVKYSNFSNCAKSPYVQMTFS